MEITTQFPKQVNLQYYSELSKYLKLFKQEVDNRIAPLLKQHEGLFHFSDSLETLLSAIIRLIEEIGGLFQLEQVENVAKLFIERMKLWQARNGVTAQVTKNISVSRLMQTFRISESFDKSLKDNIPLIKSIPKNYLDDVKKVIEDGFRNGDSYRTIKQSLSGIYKQQSWKMERIARTETAKLNTDINVAQGKSFGVDSFIWVTAADERTCKVCAPLNGQVMRFDGGKLPGHIHPQDRCTMKFVIPNYS